MAASKEGKAFKLCGTSCLLLLATKEGKEKKGGRQVIRVALKAGEEGTRTSFYTYSRTLKLSFNRKGKDKAWFSLQKKINKNKVDRETLQYQQAQKTSHYCTE